MSIDIPNYRILAKLGNGASSTLFKVRCTRTGALYTVKNVKIHTPEDNKFVEQLKAEYATGSGIDHPVVRKVFELRYVRRRLRVKGAMLFMEYVDGVPMNAPDFSRPLPKLLKLFVTVAEGLEAMHQAGYVHADLKPGNILALRDDRVKLIDLGQSCPLLTSKSRIQGTIDYMAPEQVARSILDRRTDVFGLAATLHRVITGRPIATDMNQNVTLHAQGLLGKRVTDVSQPTDAEMPPAVAKLIETCCDKDPTKRLPDMRAFIERLEMARTFLRKRSTAAKNAAAASQTSKPPNTKPE
jgi:serine/threonine-protein kinase